ncbi:hypothetical protein LY90DRAFT_509151 [Neocallimastix californiae]|uniref:Uncharacterized protein n=1 Tax=Neocallimastix californiae TaxID=1754190 RepID=A0A1Y2CI27_9FUNG|nr:hypothetical protein LY90DRAFT_509151 [Neocallimastix californiae]|eukprot:ORY46711.1 hypothetical protein LY90DRAFT_509151 [Neocallimastix californiae]
MNHNNIDMFKLLVEYSKENGIKLIIDEFDIENLISKNNENINLKNISDINIEFIELIYFYKNEIIIKVKFSGNSYFLKRLNEFNEDEKKDEEKTEKEKIEKKKLK